MLPANAADRLVCIAWYESTFNASAVSPGGYYYGLGQFGQSLWGRYAPDLGYSPWLEAALDPEAAMDVAAYTVARTGRWTHWTPVIDGRC